MLIFFRGGLLYMYRGRGKGGRIFVCLLGPDKNTQSNFLACDAGNVNVCVYYYLRIVLFLVILQTCTFVHHRFPYTLHPFFAGEDLRINRLPDGLLKHGKKKWPIFSGGWPIILSVQ